MSPRHVHIGTGKFGLGFLGHFSNVCDLKTTLLNREPKTYSSRTRNKKLADKKQYTIQYFDTKESERIAFDQIYFFEDTPSESNPLVQCVSDPQTTLLTTSIGESQLSYIASLIAPALKRRPANSEKLNVIACENGWRCSTFLGLQIARLISPVPTSVQFVDCVVDQICDRIDISGEDVVVSAETYREWIIEGEALKGIFKTPNVKFVSETVTHPSPLEMYVLRKLWLVNGFHLALAVLGATYLEQESLVSEVLASKRRELSQQVRGVRSELVNALVFRDIENVFKKNELDQYMKNVTQRFKHSPDPCERILRDALLSPARITQMTRDFGTDLGKNMRLSEVLSKHLYECLFTFFGKVKDRLFDPQAVLFRRQENVTPVYLPWVIQLLIPFLVEQGAQLLSTETQDRT